jgi:hypothetical protein
VHLAAVHELLPLLVLVGIQHVVALGAELDSYVSSLLGCHQLKLASQRLCMAWGGAHVSIDNNVGNDDVCACLRARACVRLCVCVCVCLRARVWCRTFTSGSSRNSLFSSSQLCSCRTARVCLSGMSTTAEAICSVAVMNREQSVDHGVCQRVAQTST